ncbi:MAG: hypothetical protein U0559_05370 [Anaerolineae bacterium]
MAASTNVRVARFDLLRMDMLKQLDDGLLIDLIGDSDASIGLSGDFSRTVILSRIKSTRQGGWLRVRAALVSWRSAAKSLQKTDALCSRWLMLVR